MAAPVGERASETLSAKTVPLRKRSVYPLETMRSIFKPGIFSGGFIFSKAVFIVVF